MNVGLTPAVPFVKLKRETRSVSLACSSMLTIRAPLLYLRPPGRQHKPPHCSVQSTRTNEKFSPSIYPCMHYTWECSLPVISRTSRAGELRSAPSGPDDWGRVAGKRALAPLGGARSQGHNTGLRAPRLAPRCRVRTRFPLNCSFRHVRATVVRSRCKKVSAARSPSQLALSQLGTDTRDRCAAARVGTFKKQKEATVPAVTATLAPDVRVTVRKELRRRVDFALSSKKRK